MFVRSSAVNRVLSVLFVLSVGACGNFGGCSACGAVAPLPAGGLPVDQTVEGGAQIRVTPQGFDKLTSLLPGAINQALSNGICLPSGSAGLSISGFPVATADYCGGNSGPGCNPGCKLNTSLNSLSTQVVGQNLRVNVSAQLHSTIHLDFYAVGINVDSCDMTLDSNDLNGSFDVAFGIKPADGSLDIHLANINSFSLNLTLGNCGIISDVGNLLTNLLDAIPNSIKSLLTPLIDPLIQSFLPNPLGIAGMLDVGKLLSGVSPGTQAEMEARVVPGGYVDLNNNGMSLGVIMGINSDRDPSTRDNGLQSEPALCVPPLPAPQFGQPPYSLPLTSRNTFALSAADEFDGNPDPSADLAMGVSQTSLDQLGHHAVTSGALCLGVGTRYIHQLNVGTLGLLVPSLADLTGDQSNAPLLLVTRPQRALTFTIGDGTMASPALTVGISHLEVDFYAFLYERYVRAFTMDLSMNVGVNLTFEQQPGMPATIQPTLLGIDSNSVQIKVLNSQFVKETPQHLESVLPSVFNLVTPLLGNIPPITVPSFAGFSLNDLSIQKVTTSQDKFLALYATLGAGAMARQLAAKDAFAARAVEKLDAAIPPAPPASTGRATLRSVVTPPAETVRGALLGQPGGALPAITFDVDRYDSRGRELEWTWNFNGGMWHAYSSASPLVISDPAFAWQGKYTIGLKSRVKGDYRTVSDVIETPVIIDSVGPKILTGKAAWTGDRYAVPVWDIVSGTNVQVAFGRPGEDAPRTAWQATGTAALDRAQLQELAVNGEVAVFAKDEQGNQTIALVLPFHGTGSGAGCACNTGSGPGAGGVVLFGLVGLFVLGGSRKRRARIRRMLRSRALRIAGAWLGATVLSSLVPGCSCGSHPGQACEMASDCPVCSSPNQLPFCIDGTCVCSDDIPPGRIGPYSDVAVGPDGTAWVSAYAETYGDLVVAQSQGGRIPTESWQWVDGVPAGPVTVPGSKIRGGISDLGEDVGMYTSIAVAQDGTVSVSYFDRGASGAPAANLKFAQLVNGTWQTHIVDAGDGGIDANGDSQVGMYTSLTLRSDDGRPGIAYLAHVHDAMGTHAEVRYAAAQTPHPTSSSDWQTWVVDTAALPPADPNSPDIYPLPAGLGLFIDSARDPRTQAPVVVYYDRAAGELKESRFDPTTGQFATPVVLAGMGDIDAGWSPTVQVDDQGVAHVAYVNATSDDFDYITDAPNATTETIDDGYRLVGQTVDGLPKPTFDFVGDDAGLVLTPQGPMAVYQDATTQELLLASRSQSGMWSHVSIAGATNPWPGAYGFFASAALAPNAVVMSSWVIDQPNDDNWVEVFSHSLGVQ